jgi:hypothetical protein
VQFWKDEAAGLTVFCSNQRGDCGSFCGARRVVVVDHVQTRQSSSLKSSPNHDAANLPTFLIITLLWLNKVMIQILCTIFTQQSNAFTDAASAQ